MKEENKVAIYALFWTGVVLVVFSFVAISIGSCNKSIPQDKLTQLEERVKELETGINMVSGMNILALKKLLNHKHIYITREVIIEE